MNHIILKNPKYLRKTQKSLENTEGDITLPDFKTYCEGIVIQTNSMVMT